MLKDSHHSEETKKKISQKLKDRTPWNKGLEYTKEQKKNLNVKGLKLGGMKGRKHSEETRRKMSEDRKGKKMNRRKTEKPKCIDCNKTLSALHTKTKRCWSCFNKFYVGKNSWNWRGGISPLRNIVRSCFKYRQWRSDVFTRDDFTCQRCGVKGVYLEADHYPKMFSTIFHEYKIKSLEEALNCEELWNINNGRTLCEKCHDKTRKRV